MNVIAFSLTGALWFRYATTVILILFLLVLSKLLGIVYISHTQIAIGEKIWSRKGSLSQGRIIARNGESVRQTLLTLLLSEKSGLNIRQSEKASRSLEDIIRQFGGARSKTAASLEGSSPPAGQSKIQLS